MSQDVANNILIVDDIPQNLVVLEDLFVDTPYRLVRATSGKEALMKALEQEFDLIILDVRMPQMDGFETATLLRSRKSTRYVPIIFLTAGDMDEHGLRKAYATGAVDFLHKPYHPEILKTKCKNLIEIESNRKELQRANLALELENSARQKAEKELIAYRDELEQTVVERTDSLRRKNAELQGQIEERLRTERLLVHLKDKAESATRTKDMFLANLSHELRTPLNAIIGFSSLMLDPDFHDDPAKRREHLQRIEKAGKHLLGLINDLLSFSMMETGQVKIDHGPMILEDLLKGALTMVGSLAQDKSIGIEADLGEVGRIYTDRTKLMQVLVNLLDNAVKFTPQGGKIGVTCTDETGEILLTVWDNGIGIAAEKLEDIFMEFRQVDEDLSRRYGGVGLGLAIVRRILDKIGGRIWAESRPGVGSRFFIAFPSSIKIAPSGTAVPLAAETNRLSPELLKCLVIAGDMTVRAFIAEGLRQRGHGVIEANAGSLGLLLAEEEAPDVIVIDMDLPEASAIDVICAIKQHGQMAHIPLFTIAAHYTEREIAYLKESGCCGILTKPIDMEHLASNILLKKSAGAV